MRALRLSRPSPSIVTLILLNALLSSSGVWAQSATTSRPTLTMAEFLSQVEDRLIDPHRIELRQTETRERLNHLNYSRLLEFEIAGTYEEQNFDRLEVNGDNEKTGNLRQYERELAIGVTWPILGQPVDSRLIAAQLEQRQMELEMEAVIARRVGLLRSVDLYLELYESQESIRELGAAVDQEAERVRILRLRDSRGESLRRDVLAAEAELADRRLELLRAERAAEDVMFELREVVEGTPLAPFDVAGLPWDRLVDEVDAVFQIEAAADTVGALPPPERPSQGSLWYNVPELDLTVAYAFESRDRTFADEKRSERGHSPGIQLSLEMPLDLYRAARAYERQLQARRERRYLDMVLLHRRLLSDRPMMRLALLEARTELEAAAARQALADEDLRIARLRTAGGEVENRHGADIEVLDAELAVVEARIALTRARGNLARRYFQYQVNRGVDPKEMATNLRSVESEPPASSH